MGKAANVFNQRRDGGRDGGENGDASVEIRRQPCVLVVGLSIHLAKNRVLDMAVQAWPAVPSFLILLSPFTISLWTPRGYRYTVLFLANVGSGD